MYSEIIAKSIKLRVSENLSIVLKNIKDIENVIQLKSQDRKVNVEKIIELLSKLNPLEILKKGYSFLEKDNKKILSVDSVSVDDNIDILLADGKLSAVIKKKEKLKI